MYNHWGDYILINVPFYQAWVYHNFVKFLLKFRVVHRVYISIYNAQYEKSNPINRHMRYQQHI